MSEAGSLTTARTEHTGNFTQPVGLGSGGPRTKIAVQYFRRRCLLKDWLSLFCLLYTSDAADE